MKTCTSCGSMKELTEFRKYARSKDGLASACKVCTDAASECWRQRNKDKRKAQMEKLRKELAERFREWKSTQCCKLCGECEPACLDFHHLDPSTKDGGLANMVARCTGWDKLMVEAAKCVVLCRNCHAKVHAGILKV